MTFSQLYPVSLRLSGRPCLVVGAGEVAWRKARSLVEAGAAVTVAAPAAGAEIRAAAARGDVRLVEAAFEPHLLEGQVLCIAATDDKRVNAHVAEEARRRGVLVNVVDAPLLSDFDVPAVARRGRLQLAVSTQGESPLLAARLRDRLLADLGPEYGVLTDIVGHVRRELLEAAGCGEAAEGDDRRGRLEAAVEAALGPEVALALKAGRPERAEALVRRAAGLRDEREWRVGCRGSELARRQAQLALEAMHRGSVERYRLVIIRTSGDAGAGLSPEGPGPVGAFTGELEKALAAGTIDFAVHSLKDLPTELSPGLVLAAVLTRGDPREALVSREGKTLAELPAGAVVGTSSTRREALVRRRRPDLVCRPLRGNVETRLRRLEDGDFDAIVLAAAGLERLGLTDRVTEFFDPTDFVPAAAQGFIAVECRASDDEALAAAAAAEDGSARLAAEAERAFLRRLGAGCHAPAGAYARLRPDGCLVIDGIALRPDGRQTVEGRAEAVVKDSGAAARLGAELAEDLLRRGAAGLIFPGGGAGEGRVYLVGAGPGDPGLITVKGAELLRSADCVVVDRLANPSLVGLVPASCEVVPVGKEPGKPSPGQREISEILIDRAKKGLKVVRLKGGDPFVFGRGGEEALALRAAGVPYEVVPGVTSAVAGPAYAGIPVTHRGTARSVVFATGSTADQEGGGPPDFDRLSGVDTVVVFMGARCLVEIVDGLRAGGRPAGTPAAVLARATTADQRVVTGTLGDIAVRAHEAGIENPALLVVGDVVALRDKLAWFEDLPLAGRRIVVTRAREQASALVGALEAAGAEVFRFPVIRIERPARDSAEIRRLDEAIARLADFGWLVLTSVNGVDVFFDRLAALGRDARALAGCRVAAIGPATAERLRARGVQADLVPDEFRGESLALALNQAGSAAAAGGKTRVLLVRSNLGRRVLLDELERGGFVVEEVPAYRLEAEILTPAQRALRDELVGLLTTGRVDALTFASSATVMNFSAAVGREWLVQTPRPPAVFCIGPVTAATARECGLAPTAVAPEYTIDGLVRCVIDYFRAHSRSAAKELEKPCST